MTKERRESVAAKATCLGKHSFYLCYRTWPPFSPVLKYIS
jgi:hypothetical protein